ncbi:MAG: hypothetical protein M1812_000960 [Candelaria pacifica]|nr:MAG: hypothetical protein M1812_000960 [Candelaria pacifica]
MRAAQATWLNGAIFITLTLITSSLVGLASAASAVTYVVYPKDGEKTDQTGPIFKTLQGFVGKGTIYTSSTQKHGVNFWRCDITDQQATTLKGNKNVASVSKSCKKDCYDPLTFPVSQPEEELASNLELERRVPTNQPEAEDEMVFISQRQGKKLGDMDHKYYYDNIGGKGITVYVVDTGAMLDKSEFNKKVDLPKKNVKDRARWLLVGSQDEPHDDSSVTTDGKAGKGHGTCMLSKVVGTEYGVAKEVDPVIVRVPRGANQESYLEGVSKVVDDIQARKAAPNPGNTRSVLSMSWYYPQDISDVGWVIRLRMLLRTLVEEGVIIVTGSGNTGQHSVTGYPASFAKSDVPELIVAGASDNTGKPWVGTNRDPSSIPYVWAPGVDVHCADGLIGLEVKKSSGTSLATATTAGLAAYFLALKIPGGFDPASIRTYIGFLSYPRAGNDGILGVYNGYWDPNGDAPGAVCIRG